MKNPPKGSTYIGDGVYIVPDGSGVWLYTFDGYEVTNAVYLEIESVQTVLRLWRKHNHIDDAQ